MNSVDPYQVIIGNQKADPYRIARAYGINDPVIFQALKKLLRSGRKHKELAEDVREAITSLERWEAMNAEDEANKDQLSLDLKFEAPPPEPPPLAPRFTCPDCGKPSLPGSDYCSICIHEPGPR